MAVKYGKKKTKQNNVFITIVVSILIFATFLDAVGIFYKRAEEEARENLHVQTKQIKDDISLQILSDRENLSTMANFAAKLYRDGDGYDIMFESFKPIGLFSRIGILTPEGIFITKDETVDLSGKISFQEEASKGIHTTGRTYSYSIPGEEVVRSAVPIVVDDKVVGIMYGITKMDRISEKYAAMAESLDAQLFVYDSESGDLIIDTVHQELGNISFLKDRKYNDDYSYNQLETTDKGFLSFESAYKNEDLLLHYSTIEDIGWRIALGRYDSQVYDSTNNILGFVYVTFAYLIVLMVAYILILFKRERRANSVALCASEIRKTLLETSEHKDHIGVALNQVSLFAKSRSALFFDTDGADYRYISPKYKAIIIPEKDRNYFRSELLRYATEFHRANNAAVSIMCIKPNRHLEKSNPSLYKLFKTNKIREVAFSATINNSNYITILAAINSKRSNEARMLAEKISACFSMALKNKNHLNKTELVATTDALTGVLNRVSYNRDIELFDNEKATDFSCVYIDVNELHLCNNKYGHAAGDEMLLYIANTLKEVFFGHKTYRMGGDEFVVFCENTEQSLVEKGIGIFLEQLKLRNYHVAIGMSYREQNTNTEEMVKEAEKRMYEEKAQYYQNKENRENEAKNSEEYLLIKTGMAEIDTLLSALKESYNGIYRVSLDTNKAKRILMPAYLKYNETEDNFSNLFSKYVSESVDPDYHRSLMSFLNYDALKSQLEGNKIPKIKYKKNNGEFAVLSVHKLEGTDKTTSDTLWIFSKY